MGDRIKANNIEGIVTDIGLIHTRVKGRENEMISAPNSTFIDSTLVNFSTRKARVLRMKFGVSQPDDIETIKKIVRDMRHSLENNSIIQVSIFCFWFSSYTNVHPIFRIHQEPISQTSPCVASKLRSFAFSGPRVTRSLRGTESRFSATCGRS